jgi:hypothetical protein
MVNIGLIVTGEDCLKELQIFAKTLEQWHPDATLYVATDNETDIKKVKFKGTIRIKQSLNNYVGKRRYAMESLPGKRYDTMFKDFMYEKTEVIEWMLESEDGAWFMDADINILAPLPQIPESATLALSPHYIKTSETDIHGYYNAGFIWMKNKKYLEAWRIAGHESRFFEQSALEDIAILAKQVNELYEFPVQVNFGWWRMFQSSFPSSTIQSKFTIFRNEKSVGLRYDGKALQSIHTHWKTEEKQTQNFNEWFKNLLTKFKNHPPIKLFQATILS